MLSSNHPKRAVNLIDEKKFLIILRVRLFSVYQKKKKYAPSQLIILIFWFCLFVCFGYEIPVGKQRESSAVHSSCSVYSQSRTPAHGTVPPTFWMSHPPQFT